MQSSFKKGFDKTVNADGSIAISLKGNTHGAAATASQPIGLFIAFIFCVYYSFKMMFWIMNSFNFFIWALLSVGSCFAFYLVFKWIFTKKTNLVIKPNQGIVFNGKQLPFADIQKIGINHQTTSSNLDGNAQVFGTSHGKNINITGWLPLALAEAVSDEIKKSSGMTWA